MINSERRGCDIFTLGKGSHVVKTLLVVDDYEELRKLVEFFLSARGYAVLEAPTARMAIHAAMKAIQILFC